MMKICKILTLLIAFLLILSTGVVFAAKDDSPSYKAGYDAGLSESNDYSGADGDKEKAYLKFIRIKEFEDLMDSIDDFDLYDFMEGFYEGFEYGLREITVYDYPTELGKALGNIYGARDFQNGMKSNWEKALPSDKEIRSMFNLNTQDADYRRFFIDAFKLAFKEEYILSYDKSQFEPFRVSLEQGIKDGEALGRLLGATYGTKDYYEKRDNDYTRDLPSKRVIIAEYSLKSDSEEYLDGFLSGFIRGYEFEYNRVYRDANINDTLRDEKDSITNGKKIGIQMGEMQATQDFMSKLTNDWKRSLPNESFIILEYSLTNQTSKYRDGFLAGYFDGFSEGYNIKFKELSQGVGLDKNVSGVIPLAGGSLNSLGNAFRVSIDAGTYYHPVNFSINTTYNAALPSSDKLIKASDSFRVSVLNTSNNFDDKKVIKLSFEYYGDKIKGGIYKLVDNRWIYVPTIMEDGALTAFVKPSSINSNGSTYSVFVDKDALFFSDARGHWAKDEINTYIRRGIIYGYNDMAFKPDNNITRVEFLTLLSRVYNWNLTYSTGNTTHFQDFNIFGNRNNLINYALASGYINGYDDGTFKPNNHISYKEIQIIMGRVLNNSYFRWSDISSEMLYKKKVRSASYDELNNKITRAEVIFMLYSITESKF